jgi:hypothetical protein
MMKWLTALKARFTWRWVGTVEGPTHLVDETGKRTLGGNRTCYWNLYERGDGRRRYHRIGTNYSSQNALVRESQVKAWVYGGPLPPLGSSPLPMLQHKAELVVFPGGKDSQ